jgi:hypothetical protein
MTCTWGSAFCTSLNPDDLLLYRENLTTVGRVTPQNYSTFHNRIKECIANCFESVNVTDIDHQPNGITST